MDYTEGMVVLVDCIGRYVGRIERIALTPLGARLVLADAVWIHECGVLDDFVAGAISPSVHCSRAAAPGELLDLPGAGIVLRRWPGNLVALLKHCERTS